MGIDRYFSIVAGDIDQYAILPILYHFGWMEWEELSFDWALVRRLRHVRRHRDLRHVRGRWSIFSRSSIGRTKRPSRWMCSTPFISRVGILPIVTFVLFYQVQTWFTGMLVIDQGLVPPTLETLFPPLFGHPLVTFLIYA